MLSQIVQPNTFQTNRDDFYRTMMLHLPSRSLTARPEKVAFPIGKACLPTTIVQGRAVKLRSCTLQFPWKGIFVVQVFRRWVVHKCFSVSCPWIVFFCVFKKIAAKNIKKIVFRKPSPSLFTVCYNYRWFGGSAPNAIDDLGVAKTLGTKCVNHLYTSNWHHRKKTYIWFPPEEKIISENDSTLLKKNKNIPFIKWCHSQNSSPIIPNV